jgi:hypothetical protein
MPGNRTRIRDHVCEQKASGGMDLSRSYVHTHVDIMGNRFYSGMDVIRSMKCVCHDSVFRGLPDYTRT